MQFYFIYRIWYDDSGPAYQSDTFQPCVEITDEDYIKILTGVRAGKEIRNLKGINDALEKMQEAVLWSDRWRNRDGSERSVPLQKTRHVQLIEYFLTQKDQTKVLRMQDPAKELNRPEDTMTIFRSDGTPVLLTYKHGEITVKEKTQTITWDAEEFLNKIESN